MKPVAIFALIAAWFAIGTAAAVPRGAPDADRHPTIKIEAGDQLQQAVEAIPVEADLSITPAQEADLRAWLYDFLVAFSASGNDSLAAEFYLRGGVNAEGIAELKRQLAAIKLGGPLTAQQLQTMGYRQMPELPVDATPFDLFKAMHRFSLNVKRDEFHMNRRDYCFDKVSFFDSAYRVFELQGDYYESYRDYAQTRGLLPMRYTEWSPELRGDIEEGLKLGGQWVAAEFTFIAEEPAEFAGFAEPVRHPFFVRLVWIRGQDIWRLVEAFAPNDAPVLFLFDAT